MKQLILFAVVVASLAVANEAPPKGCSDASHVAWLGASLRQIKTLKPGTARSVFLQLFQPDMGLQAKPETRYVYKQCPYIKVEVTFATREDGVERQEDTVKTISEPYLGEQIFD